MSTITREFTREQLIAKAREQIAFCRDTKITGEGRAHVNQCSALFEIALASLEAEPVGEIYQPKNIGICAPLGPSITLFKELQPGKRLYTTPPALVETGKPATFSRETNDQIAAVMLRYGTLEQQAEALSYAGASQAGHISVPDESAVELLATDLMKRIDKITGERHSVATLSSLRVSIVEACRAAMLQDKPNQD